MARRPVTSIFSVIFFSVLTTIAHEYMHIIFSGKHSIKKSVTIDLFRSVASVTITHVWAWSKFGRMIAVCAGMILDMIELLILLIIGMQINAIVCYLFSLVLITRLIWQFKLNKNTDIKILFSMIVEDPLLFKDSNKKVDWVIRGLDIVATIIILGLWSFIFIELIIF